MAKQFHPLAVNILNLQRYNLEYLTLEEVVLFDYFVVKGQSFKFKEFYHSTRSICIETGLKRYTVENTIKKFKFLKFLSIRVSGMPKIKRFKVEYQLIAEQLPMIYNLTHQYVDFEKPLTEFYQQLVVKSKQKNNKTDYPKKEKKEVEKERSSLLKSFQDFLTALQSQFSLRRVDLKIDEEIILKAIETYGFQEFKKHIFDYFQKYRGGKLSELLKTDPVTDKIEYIEIIRKTQESEVQQFIKYLEALYNKRRMLFSIESKKYPYTSLAVTQNNVARIRELLLAKSKEEIINSFIAYCDYTINGKLDVKHFLAYFLTKKEEEYDVINRFLEVFNRDYAIRN